jgi:hypothetical protein
MSALKGRIERDGLSLDVAKYFIETQLVPKIGSWIRSSTLYERYRIWCQLKCKYLESSDVKLADLFEKFLKPSRKACGKIWLDVEEAYPITWTAPLTLAPLKTIIVEYTSSIPLHQLGFAVCDLVSNIKGKLIIGTLKGTRTYNLQEYNGCYKTPDGLWIAQLPYSDMRFSFDASHEKGQIHLTYKVCESRPKDIYQIHSTSNNYHIIGYDGNADIAWFSESLTEEPQPRAPNKNFVHLEPIGGLQGVTHLSHYDISAIETLISSDADYVLCPGVPGSGFLYIEHIDGLYYHCINITPPPDADIFHFNGLKNTSLTEDMILHDSKDVYFNNILRKPHLIKCRVSFGLPALTPNILNQCTPTFDVYIFASKYRAMLDQFPNIFASGYDSFVEKLGKLASQAVPLGGLMTFWYRPTETTN